MDQFTSILTAVLTIATIVAGALAGMQRGVVTNLRETNTDLRNRLGDMTAKVLETEHDRDQWKTRSEQLESDVAALGRVVTGEAYLTALGDRLDEHHDEARAYWTQDTEVSQRILEAIRDIRSEP